MKQIGYCKKKEKIMKWQIEQCIKAFECTFHVGREIC